MPLNTQGGYSFHMAVDPASPGDGLNDIIYFGAVGQARSTDSGATFAALTGLHADTHAWAFAPQPGPFSVVYCGNDGGIFRATGGTAFTSLNGGGLQTALFYNLDVKRDATASVTLGALQDNGIVTNARARRLPDLEDGRRRRRLRRRARRAERDEGLRQEQREHRRLDGRRKLLRRHLAAMAGGGSRTSTWRPSRSIRAPTAACTRAAIRICGKARTAARPGRRRCRFPAAASEVDVAPTNSNNVVVAVGGRVLVSTNALGAYTLTDITRNLPGRFVGRVAFDPNDPATIYAVLGGFSGFPGGHVFRTTLAATTWTDISPPLDLPFNAIALDGSETPTTIYAGTDFGVLRSVDGGANWSVLDDIHFPRAPVFDLAFHDGELRAATFGRGVFSFVKPTGPAIAVGLQDNLAFGTVCQGSTHFLTIEVSNVGATDLVITSVQRLMGSTDFTVLAEPGDAAQPRCRRGDRVHGRLYADRCGRARGRDDPDHHERPERSGR